MKKITSIIREYLKERPTFYAYLRPQEAILFYERIQRMKKPILDFGCGDGFFADTIFSKKFIDVGLDLSSSRIKESSQTKVYKKTKIYDGTTIPFASQTFSTVISNCVFEHIPAIEKNIQEIHRVLKKNGILMTTVMCSSWSNNLLGKRLCGNKYSTWFNAMQQHESLFSKKEWTTLFQKAGFKIDESIDYLFEKTAQKTEMYHYFSFFSLLTHFFFKRWQLLSHVSEKKIQEIEKLIQHDTKNPSACFFVLKKV